jgi:hypothetical protein
MDTNAEMRLPEVSPQALLAALVAVPVYVLPVGFWGVKGIYPRVLRAAAQGVITLGMLSLVGLGLRGLSRALNARAPEAGAKKQSFQGFASLIPDEVAASAASAH